MGAGRVKVLVVIILVSGSSLCTRAAAVVTIAVHMRVFPWLIISSGSCKEEKLCKYPIITVFLQDQAIFCCAFNWGNLLFQRQFYAPSLIYLKLVHTH